MRTRGQIVWTLNASRISVETGYLARTEDNGENTIVIFGENETCIKSSDERYRLERDHQVAIQFNVLLTVHHSDVIT
jgi:hypothetical protein